MPPSPGARLCPEPNQLALVMGYARMGDLFSMIRKVRESVGMLPLRQACFQYI